MLPVALAYALPPMEVHMPALFLLASLALAADCPWPMPVQRVDASLATLIVDGQTLRVAGRANRTEAETALQACDDDTLSSFREWRRARRATNTWAVVGIITGGWGWIPMAWTAPRAGRFADSLETQLMTE
jgi:hypothetical protein